MRALLAYKHDLYLSPFFGKSRSAGFEVGISLKTADADHGAVPPQRGGGGRIGR